MHRAIVLAGSTDVSRHWGGQKADTTASTDTESIESPDMLLRCPPPKELEYL